MDTENQDGICKIAVTGPESSGKSDLCQALAMHYSTVWVPEYARIYLENLDRRYVYEDLEVIAHRQIEAENEYGKKARRFLFCDTEMINIRIWAEYRFGKCPAYVSEQIKQADYSLYLLCKPDIPWEPDPLRENPDDRDELFRLFITHLEKENKTYRVVSGLGKKRTDNAIQLIETHFTGQ